MAKNIFTVEDVKEFLSLNNLNWTGFIYNDETFERRLATNKDFEHSTLALEIDNEHARNSIIDMLINHFSFVTYTDSSKFMENGSFPCVDKNLSNKWQKFLLNKYKENYARLLFDWSIEIISKIQIENKEKIKSFVRQENEKANNKISKFNEIAKEAMKYLSDEDIQSFQNDII